MSRILVIGGLGFLGQSMLSLGAYRSEDDVTILVTKKQQITGSMKNVRITDLRHFLTSAPEKYDVVINMSQKRGAKTPEENRYFNFEIPSQIFNSNTNDDSIVVNFSTYIQHYEIDKRSKQFEYQQSKRELSKYIESPLFSKSMKLSDISLFTLYGREEIPTNLISRYLYSVKNSEVIEMSPGEQLISWTYVDDVVALVRQIIENEQTLGRISFWPDPPVKLKDSFRVIQDALNSSEKILWGSHHYGGHELFTYPEGVFPKQLPNFKFTTLEDGIILLKQA